MPEPLVAGQQVLSPRLWVYLGRSGEWSLYPTAAIVDTGSPATLVEPRIAHACGVTEEEIAAGEKQVFSGVGHDDELVGRLVTLDLALVPDQKEVAESGLILRASRIFVTEGHTGIILGQHDFLEHLHFEQRNYDPHRTFDLRLVKPARPPPE